MVSRKKSRGDDTGGEEPLVVGQQLRHRDSGRAGEILDVASQFTHPNAEPVYSYLVRWDDGHVEAIAEGAIHATREVRVERDDA